MGKHFLLIITLLLVTSLGLVTPATAAGTFTVTVQPAKQTISPGMSTVYTVTVTSADVFNSPVTLSLANAGSLPTSISVSSFLPSNIVTPPAGGSAFAILVIQTTGSTPVAIYTLTISGTGGSFTSSATVVLEVTSRTTFAVSVTPLSQTIGLGYSNQYQIVVASLGYFSSQVNLSLMSTPPGISYTISPSTVTPPVGGSATATLEVSVSSNVTPQNYALIISGSLPTCTTYQYYFTTSDCVHYSFVVVQVPSVTEFQITVSPTAPSVVMNQATSLTVQAVSVGGFSSDVQLNLNRAPPGVNFLFDPTTLSPTENNPVTSTLTITPTTSAIAGSYNVDVVGTSQGITKTSTITITIVAITTQLTLNPPSGAVRRGDTFSVTGSISPVISGAMINVIYTRPDGSEFTRTVGTASDGTFSDQYSAQTVDLVGTWKVRAEYIGVGAYTGSKTQTYDFQVVEKSFLEQYGLLWIADYALWIVIILIIAVILIFAVVYYARLPHPERRRPSPPAPSPPARVVWVPPAPPPVVVAPPALSLPPPALVTPAEVKTEKRGAPPLILPRKRCVNCSEVISAQAKFCDKCRAPQPEKVEKQYEAPPLIIPRVYCVNCGERISAQAKFCDKCRAPQPV